MNDQLLNLNHQEHGNHHIDCSDPVQTALYVPCDEFYQKFVDINHVKCNTIEKASIENTLRMQIE